MSPSAARSVSSQNRQRRIAGTILRKRRPSHHPQIRHLPMLQPRVDHAMIGRAAHDSAAIDVRALILRHGVPFQLTRVGRRGFDVHRLGDFGVNAGQHRALSALMVGPIEGHARQRIAVLVGVSGIEIQEVLAVSHVLGFGGDGGRTIMPGQRRFLEFRSPIRVGFRPEERMPNDAMGPSPVLISRMLPPRITPGNASSPSLPSKSLMPIPKPARAHERVQRLVQKDARGLRYLVREIPSDRFPSPSPDRTARPISTAAAAASCSESTKPQSRSRPAACVSAPVASI